jgi:hypothetical protein
MTKYDSGIPTMRMCRFIGTFEPQCFGPCRWLLESDGNSFVVCDAHLAAGVRRSGFPVYIGSQPISSSILCAQIMSGSIEI